MPPVRAEGKQIAGDYQSDPLLIILSLRIQVVLTISATLGENMCWPYILSLID